MNAIPPTISDHLAAVFELRGNLWNASFRPVPVYGPQAWVPNPGKRPKGEAWQTLARQTPPFAVEKSPELDACNTAGLRCPCSNPLTYCWLNPDSSFHLFLGQPLFAPASCPSRHAKDACREPSWCQPLLDNVAMEPRFFSYEFRKRLYDESPACTLCKNRIHSLDDSTVDHIIPYSKNGKTVLGNGQLAHRSCNASKNATVLAEVSNAE